LLLAGCTDSSQPTMQRLPVKPEKQGPSALTARVIDVSDGDTIKVLDDDKQSITIRLKHIDAPQKAQAFGNKARQALRDKIAGKTVRVIGNETDKYGRTLADIRSGDTWVNLWMVQHGWAWHYKAYSDDLTLSQAESLSHEMNDVACGLITAFLWHRGIGGTHPIYPDGGSKAKGRSTTPATVRLWIHVGDRLRKRPKNC
jgi:hypothetical protein